MLRRLRYLLIALLIALSVAVVGTILWAAVVEPSWLLPRGTQPADQVKAETDLRNTLVTLLGGLAVLTGAGVAALNLALTQRVQWRAQVTERFTRSIDQLGQRGEDKLDVRIGGVYALEQIARDSAELHWPIMEVLTAYLREHARAGPAVEESADTEKRLPADHQAIATVIGRRRREQDPDGQSLDMRKIDLPRVSWSWAHLEGALLRKANLERAMLVGAHLEGAYMTGARLDTAMLVRAQLEGADLTAANLEQANFLQAHLERADLSDAHLEGARFRKAHMEGTNLTNAHLKGANLSEAIGLTLEQLELAVDADQAALPTDLAVRLGRAGEGGSEVGPGQE